MDVICIYKPSFLMLGHYGDVWYSSNATAYHTQFFTFCTCPHLHVHLYMPAKGNNSTFLSSKYINKVNEPLSD